MSAARSTRLAAALVLLALAGCRGMTSHQPPIHLNPNMDQQKRFDPEEPNAFFPDGRADRTPPEGTMPTTSAPGDPVFETGKSGEAWSETLPAQLALDRAFLERGRGRFEIYCAPCHGAAGEGNGTVAARAGSWKPPSFHDDRLRAMAVGQIYDIATHGVRTMPAYATQVPAADRWAIAAYVRVLQRSHVGTREQVPADVATQKGW